MVNLVMFDSSLEMIAKGPLDVSDRIGALLK